MTGFLPRTRAAYVACGAILLGGILAVGLVSWQSDNLPNWLLYVVFGAPFAVVETLGLSTHISDGLSGPIFALSLTAAVWSMAAGGIASVFRLLFHRR